MEDILEKAVSYGDFFLDKLIDELAEGKAVDKILRKQVLSELGSAEE